MEKIKLDLRDLLNEKIPDGEFCGGQNRMTKNGNYIFDALRKSGYNPLFRLEDINAKPLVFDCIEITKPHDYDLENKLRKQIIAFENLSMWGFIKLKLARYWKADALLNKLGDV